ncbi:hypothetical protein Pcinc_000610 [Petrolisthes cinctipes]|uniref:RING-type domain-containing protein n=1 Tax=Petrolisthes cinctipes TaxID=88211 RepID=A0AAE1L591_PETCI|nr:hypothetical protein Pcinc_000610 [Petrolisthes cinctipes]
MGFFRGASKDVRSTVRALSDNAKLLCSARAEEIELRDLVSSALAEESTAEQLVMKEDAHGIETAAFKEGEESVLATLRDLKSNKLKLFEAMGGENCVRWFIPHNSADRFSGSTLLTDHKLFLSVDMYRLVVDMAGEDLSVINKQTKEPALHILVKGNDPLEFETALSILYGIVNKRGWGVDPNLVNVYGGTALYYALGRGRLEMARFFVEELEADWEQDMEYKKAIGDVTVISNYILSKTHPDCVSFLDRCRDRYKLSPNYTVEESPKQGEDAAACPMCLEDIEPVLGYSMRCCGHFVHSKCLMNYLSRATEPQCFLCRANIKENDLGLYDRIPPTIFKQAWERKEREEAAAVTEEDGDNDGDVGQKRRYIVSLGDPPPDRIEALFAVMDAAFEGETRPQEQDPLGGGHDGLQGQHIQIDRNNDEYVSRVFVGGGGRVDYQQQRQQQYGQSWEYGEQPGSGRDEQSHVVERYGGTLQIVRDYDGNPTTVLRRRLFIGNISINNTSLSQAMPLVEERRRAGRGGMLRHILSSVFGVFR